MSETSEIGKKLAVAMMIGEMLQKQRGIKITPETRLICGDDEFYITSKTKTDYNINKNVSRANTQLVRAGDILVLGYDEENNSTYEIIDIDLFKNEINLKKVKFFKANLSGGGRVNTFCVPAADMSDALKILKVFAKSRDYEKLLSCNPSGFFEPVIQKD